MNNNNKIRNRSFIQFFTITGCALIIAYIASFFNLRLDLTEDKRYTLSAPSREILGSLSNDVYVQVYLDGDMPIAFKRLRRTVKELLDEFKIASGRKVDYIFINPSEAKDPKVPGKSIFRTYYKRIESC